VYPKNNKGSKRRRILLKSALASAGSIVATSRRTAAVAESAMGIMWFSDDIVSTPQFNVSAKAGQAELIQGR
jgi:hypothetical protein